MSKLGSFTRCNGLANKDEMNSIYMMGFDTWSDGMTKKSYIESSSNSPKYKKGIWWLLENEQGDIFCSLIVYQFENSVYGIGSIATPREMRSNGYASNLVKRVCIHLEQVLKAKTIYLYSDIRPSFYEKCGFIKLHSQFQEYDFSICMLRSLIPPQELSTAKYF